MRRIALLSFTVGVIAKMVGVGGGVLLVPMLIMVSGLPARIAAATGEMVTLVASIVAVALYASYSQIDYTLMIPLGLGVIAGAQAGARLSKVSKGILVRRVMAAALLFVGVWLLVA